MFEDVALDVIIQGMEDERMAYPLAYGYCLVGRIVKCGRNVSKEKFLGRLAFTFAAHATHVVTSVDALQLVPSGISAEDAIFMPSVETALSLVHDAHVRVGENVAVYGQGLIGLLVTAIMYLHHHRPSTLSGNHGIITTFDTIPDRLAASALMGATQALLPGGTSGPFDVTIEVSGNARALQSAIDSTADGGRIIVGSWYGNTDVSLKLGMDFHRSHKTLQTSQVSELPASLLGLWDKKRRFGLAWELVRELRPSRLLTKTTKLVDAMEAYQALDQGTEIAVAFGYEGSSM
jgi:threonine dehydrogenase-like Zn-dependent dehydrogenase